MAWWFVFWLALLAFSNVFLCDSQENLLGTLDFLQVFFFGGRKERFLCDPKDIFQRYGSYEVILYIIPIWSSIYIFGIVTIHIIILMIMVLFDNLFSYYLSPILDYSCLFDKERVVATLDSGENAALRLLIISIVLIWYCTHLIP